jgi:Protein of unknown function (DUF5672)
MEGYFIKSRLLVVMASKNTIFIIGLLCLITIILVFYLQAAPASKAMVIVEPREHKYLKTVCEQFDNEMDPSWAMYVFHGKSAGAFAKEATRGITRRRLHLIALDTDNLNANQYNELFKKASFWNQVHAEDILVFQTDTALCPASKYKIDQFTKYDYIGCATRHSVKIINGEIPKDEHHFYGVGGLSFRKKSFMMKCIKDNPNVTAKFPEDVFFSNCVAESPNRPIDGYELSRFCSQTAFQKRSWGAHKLSRMIEGGLDEFLKFCPAAKITLG